jgi:hypothetical protein
LHQEWFHHADRKLDPLFTFSAVPGRGHVLKAFQLLPPGTLCVFSGSSGTSALIVERLLGDGFPGASQGWKESRALVDEFRLLFAAVEERLRRMCR